MQLLEDRIRKDGKVYPGDILQVDSFLNHQMDIALFQALGEEFAKRFAGERVNKILTIEASGIGIACITAQYFGVPVVFAKKQRTGNLDGDFYRTQVVSYTHAKTYDVIVSKRFLEPDDRVLLIDDFLANGKAIMGLAELVGQAGAYLVGAGIVIEKGYQPGGGALRAKGIRVESLVRIASMDVKDGIKFC